MTLFKGRPRARSALTSSTFKPALAFSALTPLYDVASALLGFGTPFKDGVAALAAVRDGENVLDLGCGTGTLLQALVARQPSARYVGIDPDPRVLALARRRLPHTVHLSHGYGSDLPFADDAFDLVVSTLVFHHLAPPAKTTTLREVHRVLRPAGRFLLVDFGRPRTALSRALLTFGSSFDGRRNMAANLGGQLPELLHDAGFDSHELRPPHREVHFLLARPA